MQQPRPVTDEQKLRVLLVDDEPDVLALLQVLVGESWEVVGPATNGPDAMRRSEETAPDVAIVDYRMPGEDGMELATRLKARHPHVIIVLFSAIDVWAEANANPAVDRFVRKGDIDALVGVLEEINVEFLGL